MANVLFLCPHGAGKSVVAATYFRAAAARIGLPASVQIGGLEPDEEIMRGRPIRHWFVCCQGRDVAADTDNDVGVLEVISGHEPRIPACPTFVLGFSGSHRRRPERINATLARTS